MSALPQDTTPLYTGPELAELEQAGCPAAPERTGMLVQLRDWAEAHLPLLNHPEGAGERERLLRLTAVCDDWPLVSWLGMQRLQRREADHEELLLLTQALWRQGRHEEAWDVSRRTLLTHPNSEAAETLHRTLLQFHRQGYGYPSRFTPWDPAAVTDGELSLEPLGHHHVDDFAWQYHDPAIAELCCLPYFDDAEHWHQWLMESRDYGDQIIFGIQHQDWGFIGSVSLVLHEGVGFFYYWLGRDFQGLGFGPRAVGLLFDIAEQYWGMYACYAKAFKENAPSIRGLLKLGFSEVDFPVTSILGGERFFRRTSLGYETSPDPANEARTLFDNMGSESRVIRLLLCSSQR